METKFQTSFIPKQPVDAEAPHHASAASLFFLAAFILFMASLASAGGVFIYGEIIKRNISEGEAQLKLNKNAFDPNTISQITRLNDRINATDYLLKKHKSVSTLFYVLSNATLKNVRFSDFNYAGLDEKISLSMKGQALSYETVALQAKEFTNPNLKNVFKSPLFGDLTLDAQGNVSFGFTTNIDPLLVDYYKLKQEEYRAMQNGAAQNGATGIPSGAPTGGATNTGEQGFIQTSSNGAGNGTINGATGADAMPIMQDEVGTTQDVGQGANANQSTQNTNSKTR